jgi:hypothetical protein
MIGYIDFPRGSHGHFLEYVVNVFILKTIKHTVSPIDSSGASHNLSSEYLKSRLIVCGHYSQDHIERSVLDKVIQINVFEREFSILAANIFCRAGNINENTRLFDLCEKYNNKVAPIRNDLYSKFLETNTYTDISKIIKLDKVENSLQVDMSSFYNLTDFVGMMNDIALYLNARFFVSDSLIDLWDQFILKNQGLQMHRKCNSVLDDVLRKKITNFNFEIIEQAYFNMLLTKNEKIFDGDLFEKDLYPTSTSVIISILNKFKNNYDLQYPHNEK